MGAIGTGSGRAGEGAGTVATGATAVSAAVGTQNEPGLPIVPL